MCVFACAVGAAVVPHPPPHLLSAARLVLLLVGGAQWLQRVQLVSAQPIGARLRGVRARVKLESESHQRDFFFFLVPNKLDWSTLQLFLISQIVLFNPPSAFNLSGNHPDYCIVTDGPSPHVLFCKRLGWMKLNVNLFQFLFYLFILIFIHYQGCVQTGQIMGRIKTVNGSVRRLKAPLVSF